MKIPAKAPQQCNSLSFNQSNVKPFGSNGNKCNFFFIFSAINFEILFYNRGKKIKNKKYFFNDLGKKEFNFWKKKLNSNILKLRTICYFQKMNAQMSHVPNGVCVRCVRQFRRASEKEAFRKFLTITAATNRIWRRGKKNWKWQIISIVDLKNHWVYWQRVSLHFYKKQRMEYWI